MRIEPGAQPGEACRPRRDDGVRELPAELVRRVRAFPGQAERDHRHAVQPGQRGDLDRDVDDQRARPSRAIHAGDRGHPRRAARRGAMAPSAGCPAPSGSTIVAAVVAGELQPAPGHSSGRGSELSAVTGSRGGPRPPCAWCRCPRPTWCTYHRSWRPPGESRVELRSSDRPSRVRPLADGAATRSGPGQGAAPDRGSGQRGDVVRPARARRSRSSRGRARAPRAKAATGVPHANDSGTTSPNGSSQRGVTSVADARPTKAASVAPADDRRSGAAPSSSGRRAGRRIAGRRSDRRVQVAARHGVPHAARGRRPSPEPTGRTTPAGRRRARRASG